MQKNPAVIVIIVLSLALAVCFYRAIQPQPVTLATIVLREAKRQLDSERAALSSSGSQGTIQEAASIDQPGDDELKMRIARIAESVMAFTAENAETHFAQDVVPYFTQDSYPEFMRVLEKSRLVPSIKADGQNVTAEAGKPLRIITRGQQQSPALEYWAVKFPLKVTYTNAEKSRADTFNLELLMERQGGVAGEIKIARWIVVQ